MWSTTNTFGNKARCEQVRLYCIIHRLSLKPYAGVKRRHRQKQRNKDSDMENKMPQKN